MDDLIELKSTGQKNGERQRRWFISSVMDLIVWSDKDSIVGFELYYDKTTKEHVFIWGIDTGLVHLAVDDGEQKPVLEYKEAPILIPDGKLDLERISKMFEGSCRNLPAEIVTLVKKKLGEYPVI